MICLDSNVIIDFLKGKKEAVEIIKKHQNKIITTEITAFEVLFGIFIKQKLNERENAKEFFDSLEVLAFDQGCAKISAEIMVSSIKSGFTIDQNDCFIAGIMIKNGINEIITKNVKHFSKIKGLKAINY